MRKSVIATIALVASAGIAGAETMQQTAYDLGNMLGAEQACGLSYKPEAIERWIADHVPGDTMGFSGPLNVHANAAKERFEQATPSQRIAQCAAVRQSAKHFGFVD